MAQTGAGSPAIFGVAMSPAERQARHRKSLTPEQAKAKNKSPPGAALKMRLWRASRPDLLESDSYIGVLLGISKENCPPELMAIKREQILLKRSLRELNKTLKEQNGN